MQRAALLTKAAAFNTQRDIYKKWFLTSQELNLVAAESNFRELIMNHRTVGVVLDSDFEYGVSVYEGIRLAAEKFPGLSPASATPTCLAATTVSAPVRRLR